jgi:hypothetical protein
MLYLVHCRTEAVTLSTKPQSSELQAVAKQPEESPTLPNEMFNPNLTPLRRKKNPPTLRYNYSPNRHCLFLLSYICAYQDDVCGR